MKKHDASVIKKGVLLSLVLLSPETLAATENLNFNYSRADALSLDPRLGIQAKACHSLGDPIDISFKLGRLSPAPVITLTIKGKAYTRSYSVFSGEKGKVNRSEDSTSFNIPFNITKNGSASGVSPVNVHVAAVTYWDKPFCFSNARKGKYPLSEGYKPLIKGDPDTGADYDNLCRDYNASTSNTSDTWGGDPREVPMPEHIKQWGPGHWTQQIFYMEFINIPQHSETEWRDFDRAADYDGKVVSGMNNYVLPTQDESAQPNNTVLDKGNFSFNLRNRNITELKVFVDTAYGLYKWEWKASTDNPNTLLLQYTNPVADAVISSMPNDPSAPTVPEDSTPPNPAKNDPYVKNGFYATNHFYKGTLAGKQALNQKYQDYVQNTVPLSLPSDSDGNINLVNTDSLTFTLRQAPGLYGAMQLSVYGQPMKFAPLKYGDKEVASAMQVRNACY